MFLYIFLFSTLSRDDLVKYLLQSIAILKDSGISELLKEASVFQSYVEKLTNLQGTNDDYNISFCLHLLYLLNTHYYYRFIFRFPIGLVFLFITFRLHVDL